MFHMHLHRARMGTKLFMLALLVLVLLLLQRSVSYSSNIVASDEPISDLNVQPGDTNVLLGSITMNATTDELLISGTNGIAPGAALTAASADLRYIDDNDRVVDSLTDGFPVVHTADNALTSDDEVVVAGSLARFDHATVMMNEANAYIDTNSNGQPDIGEDFLGIVRNIPGNPAVSSVIVKSIPNNIFVTDGSQSLIITSKFLDQSGFHRDPTVIVDMNEDGYINEADHILSAGHFDVSPLTTSDKVCFDGSISDDSEYDRGEIIWWDSVGDCATFDTGVDIVLVGEAGPTGTSHLFGPEKEVGMYSQNGSSGYDCSRGGACDGLAYTGVDGTDWNNNDDSTVDMVFFTSSSLAVDGVRNTSDTWDMTDPGLIMSQSLRSLMGPDLSYVYEDLDNDNSFAGDEPILKLVSNGGNAVLSGGETVTLFSASDHYIGIDDGTVGFNPDADIIIDSADNTLDLGLLDGSGTDSIVYRGLGYDVNAEGYNFRSVASLDGDIRYYDDNSSGTYEVGDAIVNDVDNNGYYLADDLQSIKVSSAYATGPESSTLSADLDNVLSAVYVYKPVGASCAGAGVDTLVGSITSLPIDGVDIPLTMDLFNASQSVQDRTICFYGDVSVDAPLAGGLIIRIPDMGAQFISTTSEGGDIRLNTNYHIGKVIDISLSVTPGNANEQNSFTFSYTADEDIRSIIVGSGQVMAGFPTSFGVSHASIACSVGGVVLEGEVMSGEYHGINAVVLTNTAIPAATTGDVYTCTVSHVDAPSTAGVYTGILFAVFDLDAVDGEQSILFDTNSSATLADGIDKSRPLPIIDPPVYNVAVVTPNGGEVLKSGENASITWESDPHVDYVNLAYSLDGGITYKDIVRGIPNTGSTAWRVPVAESTQAMIRIQSVSAGAAVLYVDVSDAVFTIVDPNKPYINWRSPSGGASLQAGTKQWFLWDSSNVITQVELSVSTDGGLTYPVTTGKVNNSNAYQVQLPSEDVQSAYAKIVGYAPGFNPVTAIVGPFSILGTVDTSSIKVTAPNAMQAFVPGQTTAITWETTGDVPFVEVQFAPDGKSWSTISASIPNTGKFDWTIPDIETQYGFIRVGGNSAYGRFVTDRSDEPFWIVRTSVPALTLTAPGSGSSFYRGSAINVLWKTVGAVPSANLYVVFADGAKKALALGFNNTNLYQTSIPAFVPDTFNILLEGLNAQGVVITMDTSGPFYAFTDKPIGFEDCKTLGNCPVKPVKPVPDCKTLGNCPNENPHGGIIFVNDGTVPSQDQLEIAIVDQSGLDLYADKVVPRISVANDTIELDPRKDLDLIIGTSVLVELATTQTGFSYATNDGRSEPFEQGNGKVSSYIQIGADTTHIKIQNSTMKPPYVLSLTVNPKPQGYVSGLTKNDGSEEVSISTGNSVWDSSATGQANPVHLGTDTLYAWYVPNGEYTVELKNKDGNLASKSVAVTNHIINTPLMIGEEVIAPKLPLILDLLIPNDVEQVLVTAVSNLQSNQAAQTIATIAVPASVAAVVTGATVLGSSFSLLSYLQYLFTSPLLLFGRRKRRSYGTVYNAATKAPVPFATIRFYDKDNRISRSVITDTAGRYTVALPPGEYRPVVIKPGFLFPSEQISSDVDGDLEQVYSTGFIHVTLESPFVMMHFPIDPDQIAGQVVSLRRVAVLRTIQYVIASAGVFIALYALVMNPGKVTGALLILQCVVLAVSFKLTKVHARVHVGKVLDAQGKPMSGVIVRLFESTYNKLVETQRTDAQGRYSFLAKDGAFYVVAETKQGKITSSVIDYRGETELKPVAPMMKMV